MNVIYSSGFKRENHACAWHIQKSVVVSSIGNTTTDLISECLFTNSFLLVILLSVVQYSAFDEGT